MLITDEMTPDYVFNLNRFLSKVSAIDLDSDQQQRAREYLESALLRDAHEPWIEPADKPGLERLEMELQVF